MKEDNDSGENMNLDDEIEEFLGNRLLSADLQLSPSETKELIHELKSQQLKVEALEAELKLAKENTGYNLEKQSEFFVDTPIGCLTLNRDGLIIEVNPTASQFLNQEQLSLKNTLFENYLSKDSKNIFKVFLGKVFTGNASESCEVTLTVGDNSSKFVYLTGMVTGNSERCLISAVDITESKARGAYHDEVTRLIQLVNTPEDFRKCMSDLIAVLQRGSGCEAVGIRLSEGEDYPYFETLGFPAAFVRAENQLCRYGLDGKPEFDDIYKNILFGGTDPDNPYFTLRGSFWVNSTSYLLSNASINHYKIRTIIRCNEAGYESVALIPLRSGDKVLGFLQINDRRGDRFTPVLIEEFERMADYLSLAILRRKVLEAAQINEQHLVTTLECIGDAVIATNKADEITFMNSVAEDLTGYEWSDAKHKRLDDVFKILSGQTRIEIENPENKLIRPGRVGGRSNHNILIRKDGREIPIDGSRVPIKNKSGKTTGIVITFRDITELIIDEEELIKAKEKAEENARSKSAFLANMSHEIRTPMNGILGFAELLKDPKITEEERLEYVNIIEKSGERMLNIINDIINISKVESGQMQVAMSEANAIEQVEFIYNFFKREAEQKGINLLYKTPQTAKAVIVKTDREKVYAVLTNLVKNAIKFTKQGFIEVGFERKGGYLEFYVKDTGNGIPREKQEMIFERFRQVRDTHNGNQEGYGLGLSISKAYVEMLGGKIWVESQIGQGSTFYFTLPLDTEVTENKAKDEAVNLSSAEVLDNQVKKLKVLIADDDEVSTLFLTKVINRYTKEILKVRTGIEAVEACQKYSDIDLILMDIQMPEMDGYRATEQIRRFDQNIVIVAQTAYALYNESGKAIQAGCNDYISKPINQGLLNEIIDKHFSINDKELAQGIG